MATSENEFKLGIPFVRSLGTIGEYWDSRAQAWYAHEPLGDKGIITLIQKQLWPFLNYLDKRNSVLDIAAGANNAVYYPTGFDMLVVTALDASPEALKLNPSGHKKLADARMPLEYPDDSFDAVISVFGMRYFENQEAVILEALRVLKPGMWAIFVDLRNNGHPLSVREFKSEELKAFLIARGFRGIQREILRPETGFNDQLELLFVRKPSSVTPKR